MTRLDVLLYAHDGRGLGHVSRSVAIGLALRRLFPQLRVLLVTGSGRVGDLVGPAPLDWLKLPSYASRIRDGRVESCAGPSRFADQDLARLRRRSLVEIMDLYRPRTVLCDHTPQGKHRELVPAQDVCPDSAWFLGIRGVVGQVNQVFSDRARAVFQRRFQGLLWYGDDTVLGQDILARLKEQFGASPRVQGYVSRLRELAHWQSGLARGGQGAEPLAGTVALPWSGPDSRRLLKSCLDALSALGPGHGLWRIFVGPGLAAAAREVPSHVVLEPVGSGYGPALARSRCALLYGGTNSLTDILHLGIPGVILVRELRDREQEHHLQLLVRAAPDLLHPLPESAADADTLADMLRACLAARPAVPDINLNGAENTAAFLAGVTAR